MDTNLSGSMDIQEIENYVDSYIAAKVKHTASIFDYLKNFMEWKTNSINTLTGNNLKQTTLTSYKSAISELECYLKKKHISPLPSNINKRTTR